LVTIMTTQPQPKVAPIRKALGVRSVFNILGPLTNAAGAQHVVIGVFQVGSCWVVLVV
jgi:anthranilate phosphoribosyltransferase